MSKITLAILLLFCLPLFGHDLSGKWEFTVDSSAGTGNPVVILKQAGEKLSGSYTGRYGTEPLTGTVKGDDIVFEFNMNAEGSRLKVVYKGKIQNAGNMKGEVEFGEFGNGTWTGVKK